MVYAGWTTTKAAEVSTDSAVRTYDVAGQLLQTLAWSDSFDNQSDAASKVGTRLIAQLAQRGQR